MPRSQASARQSLLRASSGSKCRYLPPENLGQSRANPMRTSSAAKSRPSGRKHSATMRSYESSGLIRAVTVWPLHQLNHGPFRLLSRRVIQVGRIYAGKPQANLVNHDGVAIRSPDPAPAAQDGFHRDRLAQLDRDGAPAQPASAGAIRSSCDSARGGLFRQTAAPPSKAVPCPKLYPRFVIVIA